MGGNQSTLNKDVNYKFQDIEPIDAMHLIATKYILTQNFTDMKKLSSKEYCDKLIILTSDIVKKFMTSTDIKYLSHRVENGVPINQLKTEKLIFLDVNDINEKKKIDKEATTQKYVYENNIGFMPLPDKHISKKKIFETMDVNSEQTKNRMCKGIAKFYIKIAHLFSAISQTINPVFSYMDIYGKEHNYSLKNKGKIPINAKIKVSEINLCTRRINALTPSYIGSTIKITPSKICSLNKKTKTTKQDDSNFPSKWGKIDSTQRNLGDESGIPELEKLFYDNYDYTSGKYISMSKNNKKEYEKKLKSFYINFTGEKKVPYDKWNINKNKKFSDIQLTDFEDSDLCNSSKTGWRKSYEGESDLYKQYATHFKEMMSKAKNGQKDLIAFLDKIFIWQKKEEQNILTIHPDLTEKKLDKLTNEIRDKIIDLYFNCEKDFKNAIDILASIIAERNLKTATSKNKILEQDVAELTGKV